ncbi:MAG: hypothetical protein IJ172_00555 [Ruminococcus sp.]|nr:hypothetical protein [Ruminococcus sp.]MBQ8119256.1 hypothetical protein [Ruminococcus sp.]
MTIADIVGGNDKNLYVMVSGRNPDDDCDCLIETYYMGPLKDIPEKLLKEEVLCTGWSFGENCPTIDIDIAYRKEKEPVSAATDASSSVNDNIQNETTEKEQPCAPSSPSHYIIAAEKSQALKALEEAREGLLDIYDSMDLFEQRAFEIGKIYGKIDAAITREEVQE